MSKSEIDRYYIVPEVYNGVIEIDGTRLEFSATVYVGKDFRLVVDVTPLDLSSGAGNYLKVAQSYGKAGERVREFSLTAHSDTGKVLKSTNAFLTSLGSGPHGHSISIATRIATIVVPTEQSVEKPIVRMWFRGFQCAPVLPIDTPLGQVSIFSKLDLVPHDEVSGGAVIESADKTDSSEWCRDAEAFLKYIRQGLGFARGGWLQVPAVKYYTGDKCEVTFYAGSGSQGELPVQYFHLAPYCKRLTARYFEGESIPDIIWAAVDWMQIDTMYHEVRFLTGMIALEALSTKLPDTLKKYMPSDKFKPVQKELKTIIDQTIDTESKQRLIDRIGNLNEKSFKERIEALFDHYGIESTDFDDNIIRSMVSLRNKLIHRGVAEDRHELWENIILVRELIARIFLKEIGFEGRYDCYIGGQHTRLFPSCTPS